MQDFLNHTLPPPSPTPPSRPRLPSRPPTERTNGGRLVCVARMADDKDAEQPAEGEGEGEGEAPPEEEAEAPREPPFIVLLAEEHQMDTNVCETGY